MAAQIQFVQGLNTPPGGQALAGVTGVLVTASHSGGGIITSYVWTIVDVPPGSVVPTGLISTSSSFTFTPDLPGGYLVQLVTTDNMTITTSDLRAVLVAEDTLYGRYIPPYDAPGDALNIGGQARGWATFMEDYLHLLDRLRDVATAAPNNGDVLTWDAVNSYYAPSPGGGIVWPGPPTDLLAADGSAVTVGANLALVAGVLSASGGGGMPAGLPLHWEIPLLAGVAASTGATLFRVASRDIDLSAFPASYDSKSLQVLLHVTLEVTGGTATATLYDITPLIPVAITNATLTTGSANPVSLISAALPVANVNGSIWVSPVHLYELDIQASLGNTVTCSGAWLSIDYI